MSFDPSKTKYRVRLVQLLTAAEHAALTPIALEKLHAFAFLADVLSPVWNLRPFEDRIGRTGRPPYYPDLQLQLDVIVCMGLVEPAALSYFLEDDGEGARFKASYALRFESSHLQSLIKAIQDDPGLSAD